MGASDAELAAGAPSPGGGGGGGGLGGSALLSDTTGLVGTSYYISPEIREGWASYDAKVDLYSLGIMTFELWYPFATAMERAVLLRDLRERGGVMPAAFEAEHPTVARLIRWLLAPNPADRPTAMEVLRSELLPPQASHATPCMPPPCKTLQLGVVPLCIPCRGLTRPPPPSHHT